MSAKLAGDPIADGCADVAISEQQTLADGFRRYQRSYFTLAGEDAPRRADLLRAGPAVGILPIDLARGEVVLLRQFRLAAHLADGKGHLIELAAGHVEAGEAPIEAARRECVEEIGVAPDPLIELLSYFPTPGTSDERVTLFLGVIDALGVPERAGLAEEREDIRPMRCSIDAVLAALADGAVANGLLVTALQWLAINRSRLPEIVRAGASRNAL